MKGDGEGESEGARENDYGKLNNDIKISRRKFVKQSAAFGAAVAGIPYNLTDITDILKEDGELVIYPLIYEYKLEPVRKVFKERFIFIKLWGCIWNCRWCPVKSTIFKNTVPITISIDQMVDLSLNLANADTASTAIVIRGGEPLLQKEEVLKLIESLKTKADYPIFLKTTGSLIEESFIDKANDLGLNGIMMCFYSLDDRWHRWYTGHSNKDTINALKLVTERFKGKVVVNTVLFPEDMVTFEKMCKFLHEINPNFIIKIAYPPHKYKKYYQEKKRYKAEEIALRYFKQVERSIYFSKQTKHTRYLAEGNERGHMDIIKSGEWIREGGRGGELLGDDKNKRGGKDDYY